MVLAIILGLSSKSSSSLDSSSGIDMVTIIGVSPSLYYPGAGGGSGGTPEVLFSSSFLNFLFNFLDFEFFLNDNASPPSTPSGRSSAESVSPPVLAPSSSSS
jgi:hypothetical protein